MMLLPPTLMPRSSATYSAMVDQYFTMLLHLVIVRIALVVRREAT